MAMHGQTGFSSPAGFLPRNPAFRAVMLPPVSAHHRVAQTLPVLCFAALDSELPQLLSFDNLSK
jgi:hypothetical protein